MTTADTAQTANKIVAALDIGTSAIRMAIAEVTGKGEVRVLETPAKPVPIGRDVFTTGRISRTTRGEVINVLRGFKKLMETYQVSLSRVIATSAVREAVDRDTFLDWIYVRTGLDVEVIEGIEENQLTLSAVQAVLGDRLAGPGSSLIMEVGGGSTELMILDRGEIVLSQTLLPLGSVRMQQRPESLAAGSAARVRLYRRDIDGAVENIVRQCELKKAALFVALGSEMRFVARRLADPGASNAATFPAGQFQEFVRDLARLGVDELVDRFGLPFADAETLTPALMIYSTFLEATGAEQVTVPMVSIRDALLLEMAAMVSGRHLSDFSRQVIASAKALGRKYGYDEKHALNVTTLSLRLFDELAEEHSLGQRERLLLHVAGILHDIGIFIGNTAHHKHGHYIICESDVFGLRKSEKDILADVVRYHRKATPRPTHVEYMSLPRADRVVVSKLAAILRVADALDRAHLERIKDFQVERRADAFVIKLAGVDDLSVERGGLKTKGDLFEDVYGMTVVLEDATTA